MSPAIVEPPVEVAVSAGVAYLTLNRPHAGNSINLDMVGHLETAMADLSARVDIGAMVISGSGDKFFCAGGDLDEYLSLDPETGARDLSLRMQRVLSQLATFAYPTIAALNGYVIGGGLEVALACDFRVAESTTIVARPEVGMGLVPPWGGINRMRDLLGRSRTLHVMLAGSRMDAGQALNLGLVDSVHDARTCLVEATRMAEAIAALPGEAVQAAKQMLGDDNDPQAVANTFGRLWVGEHHRAFQRGWECKRQKPGSPGEPASTDGSEDLDDLDETSGWEPRHQHSCSSSKSSPRRHAP